MRRLSRHARNRLRWVRREAPEITEAALLAALDHGQELGADRRGNVRIAVEVAGTRITAVVDTSEELVITVWRD